MAQNLKVCAIDDGLMAKLKKFRFRKEKNNAAIIMKIDTEKLVVCEDDSLDEDELNNVTLDDLQAVLPAHLPRYVAYSYVHDHDDGRKSYPLCFIFISPAGCKPEMQMMYAGSKLQIVHEGNFTKVFEIRDLEELTDEWLKDKIKFFR